MKSMETHWAMAKRLVASLTLFYHLIVLDVPSCSSSSVNALSVSEEMRTSHSCSLTKPQSEVLIQKYIDCSKGRFYLDVSQNSISNTMRGRGVRLAHTNDKHNDDLKFRDGYYPSFQQLTPFPERQNKLSHVLEKIIVNNIYASAIGGGSRHPRKLRPSYNSWPPSESYGNFRKPHSQGTQFSSKAPYLNTKNSGLYSPSSTHSSDVFSNSNGLSNAVNFYSPAMMERKTYVGGGVTNMKYYVKVTVPDKVNSNNSKHKLKKNKKKKKKEDVAAYRTGQSENNNNNLVNSLQTKDESQDDFMGLMSSIAVGDILPKLSHMREPKTTQKLRYENEFSFETPWYTGKSYEAEAETVQLNSFTERLLANEDGPENISDRRRNLTPETEKKNSMAMFDEPILLMMKNKNKMTKAKLLNTLVSPKYSLKSVIYKPHTMDYYLFENKLMPQYGYMHKSYSVFVDDVTGKVKNSLSDTDKPKMIHKSNKEHGEKSIENRIFEFSDDQPPRQQVRQEQVPSTPCFGDPKQEMRSKLGKIDFINSLQARKEILNKLLKPQARGPEEVNYDYESGIIKPSLLSVSRVKRQVGTNGPKNTDDTNKVHGQEGKKNRLLPKVKQSKLSGLDFLTLYEKIKGGSKNVSIQWNSSNGKNNNNSSSNNNNSETTAKPKKKNSEKSEEPKTTERTHSTTIKFNNNSNNNNNNNIVTTAKNVLITTSQKTITTTTTTTESTTTPENEKPETESSASYDWHPIERDEKVKRFKSARAKPRGKIRKRVKAISSRDTILYYVVETPGEVGRWISVPSNLKYRVNSAAKSKS